MDLTRATIAELKAELERKQNADLSHLRNEIELMCAKAGYTLGKVFFFSPTGKKPGRKKH